MAKASAALVGSLQSESEGNNNIKKLSRIIPDGSSVVFRMVPVPKDAKSIARPVGLYFFDDPKGKKGDDGKVKRVVLYDPLKTYGRPCPLTTHLLGLKKAGTEEQQKLAGKLLPAESFRMRVWLDSDLKKKGSKAKAFAIACPYGVYSTIRDVFVEDGEDISDAIEGRAFRVKRTGAGIMTRYEVRILDASPINKDPVKRKILTKAGQAVDIESDLRDDAEALDLIYRKLFKGGKALPKSGFDDDDETPKKKKRVIDEDDIEDDEPDEDEEEVEEEEDSEDEETEEDEESEDEEETDDEDSEEEEEEDEETDDEEEEEEAPKKSKKKKKPVVEEDEDEEEDEETEDDEDDESEDVIAAVKKKSKNKKPRRRDG